MTKLIFMTALGIFFTGCSNFTFEPESTPPKNEYDQIVHAQKSAMAEQQEAALNK